MDAHKKVALAREHLIMDQRFFGTIICSMKIVAADRVRGFPINTMATDGTYIWFNPGFVDTLTLAETIGVLMHEVLHKANAHHLRQGGRGMKVWNQACDYAINPIVIASKNVLPEGGLLNKAFADWSAEEIYEKLVIEQPKQSQTGKGSPTKGKGSKTNSKEKSDERSEDGADDDDGDAEAAAKNRGQEDDRADLDGDGDRGEEAHDHEPEGLTSVEEEEDDGEAVAGSGQGLILPPLNETGQAMSPAEMQEAADELRVEIINAARIAMSCGEAIPPGVARIVEDAKNPRPDWRDMLRRFVSKAVEVPVDQTWARPNRRFIHQGIYLPGWRKEGTNNLLMVIDSSGSTIRTPALPRFYAEMKRILADTNPDSVTVMWCDSVVRRAETYTDPSQIPQICPGGGGTRFSPVWRKVEEMNLKPSGCVFFTDLICSDFGARPDFPVLWAKWGKGVTKPPFGDVLDINQP